MGGLLGVVEGLGVVVGLLALALGLLALRRRWLSRQGGTFECSLRTQGATPGAGWVLGVARYDEGILQWFRFFSYALRPRQVFTRDQVRVLESRDADPVESVSLGSDQRVVRIDTPQAVPAREWELAMNSDSLTGLLSWLEAAPPGPSY